MRPLVTLLSLAALLAGAGCASSPSASQGSPASAGGAEAATAGAQSAAQPASGAAAPAASAGAAAGGGQGGGTAAAGSADAAGVAAGPAQTSDERRAAIDQRLTASLGAFDAQLRQEQQQVAQERDARQSAAAASAAAGQGADKGEGSATTEGPPGEGDRGNRRPGTGRRHDPSGDLKSEKAAKQPDDNAGNGAVAREIPDGSDDDVVARRLRQAAEQETDPELKEKLWQEYLDYKKNAQGKTS